ncbi:MAG: phnA protein [Deltaproteobacteria bacterium]|nr:phnA protein [Deltaproteobacteria bacterium]
MARGHDLHQERLAAINALGRSLSRRARSRCELCEDSTGLQVVEVAPVFEEPDEDRALMLCERCRGLEKAKRLDPTELRFLEGVAWSEVLPVQLTAIRVLRRLAADEVSWARDTLDGLWLPEEITELLDA